MTTQIHTRDQAKARAREIRAALAAGNHDISHSAALERVAAEAGYSSWNAMSARLSNEPDVPLQVGERVAGRYLKQPFAGTVLAVRNLGHGAAYEVTVEFDEPVDVVTFESFSAFRQRVKTVVTSGGVSPARTSDGVPHMTVAREDAAS